jgi:hypothetical protein
MSTQFIDHRFCLLFTRNIINADTGTGVTERPIPELAPVMIAFWPLSSLRFSVLGTTGFGRSLKSWECGIFGFARLAASSDIVGISFFGLRIRRQTRRFLTTWSKQDRF